MATKMTAFDDLLKDKLHRDLIFRGITWITIPCFGSYYAIHEKSINPVKFMLNTVSTIMDLLNTFGLFVLILACLALMFKDLEGCDVENWGANTKRGYLGGIIRRLAGDLTLWSLGLLISIFTVVGVAAFLTKHWTPPVAIIALIITPQIFIIGKINILVRRKESTNLTTKLKKPYLIALLYLTVISILVFSLTAVNHRLIV